MKMEKQQIIIKHKKLKKKRTIKIHPKNIYNFFKFYFLNSSSYHLFFITRINKKNANMLIINNMILHILQEQLNKII